MVWLLTYNTLSAQNQLISAEYYFGTTDPGQGLASPLTVSDGAFDEAVESIFSDSVLIALADSNFILNVRVKDQNGLWGPVFTKAMHWSPLTAGVASSITVLQMNDMRITAGEYFLGMSDPGNGNATPILALDGNFNEAVESLFRSNMVWNNLPSPTLFNIRVRDINGVWGPLFKKAIMPSGTRVSANLIAEGDTLHICENLPITLHYAGPNGFSLQWFNNSVTDSLTFVPAQSGYYTLSAQQGAEYYTDSIYVQVHPIASSIIAADTLRLCGNSYTLQADTWAYSYAWNTGAINTTTININQSGWYCCTYSNISCSRKDSVFISLLDAHIVQNDTMICAGNSVILNTTFNPHTNDTFYVKTGEYILGEYYDFDDFEGGAGSSDDWTQRDAGIDPQIVSNTAFSGTHSLYFSNGWGRNYEFGTVEIGQPSNGYYTADYPYMSMAYKIPNTSHTSMLVHIAGYGWRSIAFTQGEQLNCYSKVASWNADDALIKNNQWHFKTINLHNQLQQTLGNGNFKIEAIIFYDACGQYGVSGEFWIDQFMVTKKKPSTTGPSYSWITNETTAAITVNPIQSETYFCTTSNGISTCTDSVTVVVNPIPQNFISDDTIKVCGNEQMLVAGTGFNNYQWNTGANTQTIQASLSGVYQCQVIDSNGCQGSDAVWLSIINSKIVPEDTFLCAGNSITLSMQNQQTTNTVFTIPNGTTYYTDNIRAAIVGNNASGQNSLQLYQTTGFQVGDTILTLIMQQNPNYSSANLGQYQYNKITAIQNNTLQLLYPLSDNFGDVNGMRCQAIKVPTYDNLVIDGTLTCHAWDGITGGVLATLVKNEITVNQTGIISASGKGFRGGVSVPSWGGGNQGEGIYGLGGRSPYANSTGGGGGNAEWCAAGQGGGGGAWGTYNGLNGTIHCMGCGGGWYFGGGCGNSGFGGSAQSYSSKIVLGSGGGSGGVDGDNPDWGGYGGNGGGAMLIYASNLTGDGQIVSDGMQGDNSPGETGGGGGGSGGYIGLNITPTSSITIHANGGLGGKWGSALSGGSGANGGIFSNLQSIPFLHKYIYQWSTGDSLSSFITTPTQSITYTCSVSDGVHTCYDTAHIVVNPLPSNIISADTLQICASTYVLEANNGFSTYAWSTGDHTQSTPINSTGWYFCTVTNANGCSATDSVFVSLINGNIQTPDTTICWGNSIGLQIPTNSSYQSISWSSGGALSTEWVNPLQNTVYTCTVTNAYHSCVDTVQITVSHPDVQVAIGTPTVLCSGNSLTLQGTGAMAYSWTPSVQNGLAFIPSVGTTTYSVIGIDAYGCVDTASHTLTVNPTPSPAINASSTLFCYGLSANLSGIGANSYTWAPASSLNTSNGTQVIATPQQTTTYTVTGTNVYGCSASASITLLVKPQPTVIATGNLNYCNGQSVAAVPLSGTPANVSFDISGGASRGMPNQTAVTSLPAFTAGPVGSSLVSIVPKANGCTGPTYTYTLAVSNCSPVTLNTKFYLQGYYAGAGQMQPVLYNQGAISSPSIPYCDYVVVELHEPTPPYSIAKTSLATLKTNGTLQCSFPGSVTGNSYYIVVNHRNTLSTWSSNPVLMQTNTNYDFSIAANKVYGNNQILLEPGVYGFYSADINQDENIDLLDLGLLETDVLNFESGYLGTDINGDGNVDLLDFPTAADNITNFIYSFHP